MKYLLLIVLLFSFGNLNFVCGQDIHKIDSLRKEFYKAKTDSSKWNLVVVIAANFQVVNVDSSIFYGKKALSLAQKLSNKEKAYSSKNLASYYGRKKVFLDSSLFYINLAKDFFEVEKDTTNLLGLMLSSANVYTEQGRRLKVNNQIYEALNFVEKTSKEQFTQQKISLYYALATNQTHRKKYSEAIEIFRKQLDLALLVKTIPNEALSYIGLATVYERTDKFDSAIFYNQKALQLAQKYKQEEWIANQYNNIGYVYFRSNNYSEASSYFLKAITKYKELGLENKAIYAYLNIARLFVNQKKYNEAKSYLDNAQKRGETANDLEFLSYFYEVKVNYLEGINQYKEANVYQKRLFEVKDSLENIEENYQIEDIREKYETSKKELEIEQLNFTNKKQELETELTKQELKTSQLTTFASIGIGLLLLSILGSIFFVRNQRAKRKEAELEAKNQSEQRKVIELELNNQLAKQKAIELENKNKEIAFRLEKTKTEMENRITEERNQVFTKAFEDMGYYIHNEAGGVLTLAIEELTALPNQEEVQNALKDLKELKQKFRSITRIFENFEEVGTLQFRLEQYNRLIAKNNPSIFFEYEVEIPQLTTEIKGNKAKDIYFVIQEFVENAIKYAEASKISVIIEIDEDNQKNESNNLLIKITDDGKGFDTQTTKKSGIKLTTRKIEELGGNIIIHSSSIGTQIEIRFPNTKEDTTSIEIDLKSI